MELNEAHDPIQRRYALWLAWGTRLGLAFLVLAFAAYLLGVAPHVPIERLPALWQLSAPELLRETGLEPGWQWASLLHRSDMLLIAAIALLSSISVACVAAVLPAFARRGDRVFVAICVLQVGVLLLAASGLLAGIH
jgi:hypothetical protein